MICKFCNKEFNNKRSYGIHLVRCQSNPDRIAPANHYIKAKRDGERIVLSNETIEKIRRASTGRKHSKATKEKLSKARSKYLKDNPDKHPWKTHDKFISKPCEDLKKIIKEKVNYNFIEEFKPLKDRNFSADIAFPELRKIIEVNGNQHYNKDGSLSEYYQNRHNLINNNNWEILELHYTMVYKDSVINIINDFLENNITHYDFDWNILTKNKKHKKSNEERKLIRDINQYNKYECVLSLILTIDNIDFSKYGWLVKLLETVNEIQYISHTHLIRVMKKYIPEFYDKCYKRNNNKL
jgi:very-short-patch-repair endonuclease